MSRERLWRKRVEAFERSGLTQSAWCRRHGVALSSLGRWRARLQATTTAQPGLVPIVVDAPRAVQVEIVFGPVQVRVPTMVDADWLARLVRGLA